MRKKRFKYKGKYSKYMRPRSKTGTSPAALSTARRDLALGSTTGLY